MLRPSFLADFLADLKGSDFDWMRIRGQMINEYKVQTTNLKEMSVLLLLVRSRIAFLNDFYLQQYLDRMARI